MKNKRVHSMRYATRDEAIADLFAYIEPFYNQSRRHSTIGYIADSAHARLDHDSA